MRMKKEMKKMKSGEKCGVRECVRCRDIWRYIGSESAAKKERLDGWHEMRAMGAHAERVFWFFIFELTGCEMRVFDLCLRCCAVLCRHSCAVHLFLKFLFVMQMTLSCSPTGVATSSWLVCRVASIHRIEACRMNRNPFPRHNRVCTNTHTQASELPRSACQSAVALELPSPARPQLFLSNTLIPSYRFNAFSPKTNANHVSVFLALTFTTTSMASPIATATFFLAFHSFLPLQQKQIFPPSPFSRHTCHCM